MLCLTCSKLSVLSSKRICLRCKGGIYNNMSVVCDNCSNKEQLCSICLKKIFNSNNRIRPKSNCSSCGK